jgi:hypothetical protein
MNKAPDSGWDQIQARIDQMLGKYIGQELHKIDGQPQDLDYMLHAPPDYRKDNQRHHKSRNKKLLD